MRLNQALSRERETLLAGGIKEDVRLECELLLMHALGINRVQLYLDLDRVLTSQEEDKLRCLIKRRLKGEPVAYITAHHEFYGLDFYVDNRVLIPRPETELLVEKALSLSQPGIVIADIGTGSGAIAISLAVNLPDARIYATDISPVALEVAALNCAKHGVSERIRLLPGDLLEPLPEPVNLIVANLPYVAQEELRTGVRPEPLFALDGGTDGLEQIRRLCHRFSKKLLPGGHLLLEVGQGQTETVTCLVKNLHSRAVIEIAKDLAGIDRMVSISLSQVTAVAGAPGEN